MTLARAWASTVVKERGASYSPRHGDKCPVCRRILREGEEVYRVTDRPDSHWLHEECARD